MPILPSVFLSLQRTILILLCVFEDHFQDLRYCRTQMQEFCVLRGQNLFLKTYSVFDVIFQIGFQRLSENRFYRFYRFYLVFSSVLHGRIGFIGFTVCFLQFGVQMSTLPSVFRHSTDQMSISPSLFGHLTDQMSILLSVFRTLTDQMPILPSVFRHATDQMPILPSLFRQLNDHMSILPGVFRTFTDQMPILQSVFRH